MAEVKWIKLATDMFEDEKILLTEGEKKGDSYIVIWLKLLCLAGRQNNSGVFQIGDKPMTVKQFARLFHRSEALVKSAFELFEAYGMIKTVNGTVTLPNWGKHQSLDRAEEIKEQNRRRAADFRARQKRRTENESKDNVMSNGEVTQSNGDRIRSKKKETEPVGYLE